MGSTGPSFPGAKVRTPIPDYLDKVLDDCRHDESGNNADYIAELRDANPNYLGLCLSTADGFVYGSGDTDVEFSIQSISKAFVYALALEEWGIEHVLTRVGVEPSGEAFNELTLDSDTHNPLNPMINAGAITTHSLVGPRGLTADQRFERILDGLSAFAGRELGVDEKVFESEMSTAYRNTAIACMLRNYSIIESEPEDIVRGYTRQCAISVSCRDLAVMGATLANGGVQPVTGVRVVRRDVVKQVLSVMFTCGMYNGAGAWVTNIGFPAKSGVAGGVLGVLPGQVGISTFSPRLNQEGNSVRGVHICKRLSEDMGLHIMDSPEPARSVIRRDYLLKAPPNPRIPDAHRPTVGILSIQGTISFAAAERVLRVIYARSASHSVSVDGVVLDMRSVYSIDAISRRMFREVARRIRKAGMRFAIIDPDNLMGTTAGGASDDRTTLTVPSSFTDDTCQVDAILDDLSPYKSWEKLPLPDTMRTMPLSKEVQAEMRH
jgi:glutaminase